MKYYEIVEECYASNSNNEDGYKHLVCSDEFLKRNNKLFQDHKQPNDRGVVSAKIVFELDEEENGILKDLISNYINDEQESKEVLFRFLKRKGFNTNYLLYI